MQYTNEQILKRKQRKEKINSLFRMLIYIVVIPIIAYNIYIITLSIIKPNEIPTFFGIKTFVIISGSMEPTLNIGDVIIVKKVESSDLNKNEIISFREGQSVITHRIIDVIDDKYITKGDNNNVKDDNIVDYEDIEGKYIGKIPYLGNVVIFLKNKIIIILIIIIFYIIYFYNMKMNNIRQRRQESRKLYEQNEQIKKSKEY